MGKMPWGTYLWPGLSLIWRHGSWLGLAIAVGFTALVNLALASSILWSELFTAGLRSLIWAVVGGIWAVSAIFASRWDSRGAPPRDLSPRVDSFALALDHYLKGNWFEAEYLLSGLLAANPRNVDASLMLATLWRHTGRFEECWKGWLAWMLRRREEVALGDQPGARLGSPGPDAAGRAEPGGSDWRDGRSGLTGRTCRGGLRS